MALAREARLEGGLLWLAILFASSLTASQFIAAKVVSVSLPGIGEVLFPAAVVIYAATFLFTDVISEVYGKKAAASVVRAGFFAQLLVLAYSWASLKLPYAPVGAPPEAFEAVVGAAPGIVAASLIAYLASQHHDVWAFHWWREKTQGRWLWLRNNASTMVSQLIDTVLFITLAFHVFPSILGGMDPLPWRLVGSMILGQYAVKVLVAAADTPLVYLGVALLRGVEARGLLARRGAVEGVGGIPGRRQAWP